MTTSYLIQLTTDSLYAIQIFIQSITNSLLISSTDAVIQYYLVTKYIIRDLSLY